MCKPRKPRIEQPAAVVAAAPPPPADVSSAVEMVTGDINELVQRVVSGRRSGIRSLRIGARTREDARRAEALGTANKPALRINAPSTGFGTQPAYGGGGGYSGGGGTGGGGGTSSPGFGIGPSPVNRL